MHSWAAATQTARRCSSHSATPLHAVESILLQAFVDRFRYNANRAALVQSRLKAIERLGEVEEVVDDPEYVFTFPQPGPVPPPIIGGAFPGGLSSRTPEERD